MAKVMSYLIIYDVVFEKIFGGMEHNIF